MNLTNPRPKPEKLSSSEFFSGFVSNAYDGLRSERFFAWKPFVCFEGISMVSRHLALIPYGPYGMG